MAREPLRKYQTELSRYGLGLGGIGSPSKARFDAPLKSGSIKRSLKSGIGSAGPLRTVFAEEGPASGGFSMERELYQDDPLAGLTREESVDLLKSMGIDMGNPTLAFQSIVERAKRRPESVLPDIPSDVGNISELAKAYAKVVETARPEASSTLPSVEDILSADPSVFDVEGPEITKLKKESAKSLGISGPKADELARAEEKRKKDAEDFRAEEAKIAEMQGMRSERVSLEDIIEPEKKDDAIEDTFFNAMSEYKKILGEQEVDADPSNKKERLQKYMKEFSDITGVDLDGKVDKSQALMAMGLALMQNRAGKGFNVGRMLSSVGEAGQAAMPYLTAAKKEAKENRLLAGQYALEQEQSRLAREAATAKDANDFQQQMYLKWYESKLQRQEDSLKAAQELEKAKLEGGVEYNKKHEFKFATGSGDASSWSIPVIYDAKSPSGGIILKPDAMARKYIDGREGVEDAISLISEMRSAAQDIAEGGGTTKFAFDRVNSIAKALFPDLNTGEPTSEQEYAQGVNLIMGRFKRFLTQETGNGISNRDVEIWENEIMKKPSWFTNFDETNSALSNLEDIFLTKLTEYDAGLDFIFDPENLKTEDYNKLTEKYGDVADIKFGSGALIFKDGKMVRK